MTGKQSCVHSMLPQGKMAEKEIHSRVLEASVSYKKEKKKENVSSPPVRGVQILCSLRTIG